MNLEVLHREPATNSGGEAFPHLVFVHGACHAAWTWDDNFLPWFAERGFRCVALSLRGHGKSDGRERLRWHSLSDYAADVVQVVDEWVGDQPFVLISHSMGGVVVQRYLAEPGYPRPTGVAFLGTIDGRSGRKVILSPQGLVLRHPKSLLRGIMHADLRYVLAGTPALTRESFFTAQTPAEIVQQCHDRLRGESWRVFFEMLNYRMCKIDVPVCVMGSKTDGSVPLPLLEALVDVCQACGVPTTYRLFDQIGHDLMLDSGWPTVAEAIAEFVLSCERVSSH